MEPRLETILNEVTEDTGSGAAEILQRVLDSLSTVLERPEMLESDDLVEFSILLQRAKRSMAPLFNLANRILIAIESEDWMDSLIKDILQIRMELDIGRKDLIDSLRTTVKGMKVMTISYSSTVLNGLVALGQDLDVIVPVSLPMGEGRETAKALTERGIRTEIIHDSMIFSVMEEADLALVGADALTPMGVVNKVGTFPLVAAARRFSLPAYAVCDWMKVSPVEMLDPIETQTQVGNNLMMRERVFELTPLDLFSSIVTDRGSMTPQEIRGRMKGIRVSDLWSSRR
jgi:translation initiation factor 2B subunit (eIF-2B alpha/beta/delta family)